MKRIKKKASSVYRKYEKKARPFVETWRFIVSFLIFLLIAPAFASSYDNPIFYPVMIAITALVYGLVVIVRRSFTKKLIRDYLARAKILLLIGGILIAVIDFLPLPPFLRWVLLLFSAFIYAMAAQRLGLGILIGGGF